MGRATTKLVWGLSIFLLVAVVYFILDRRRPPPRCPEGDIRIYTSRMEAPVTQITLAGNIDRVPEFHDCQRFTPASGKRYGSMVAIWIAQDAGQSFPLLPADSGVQFDSVSGILTDSLHNPPGISFTAGLGVAIAVVHDWDDRYAPLGIDNGFNCLYIMSDPTSPTGWRAKMHPLGPDNEAACSGTADFASLAGKSLQVIPDPDVPASPVIPPVARWDWDGRNNEHYIGIICGVQWCEIGDSGFVASRQRKWDDAWDVDEIPGHTTGVGDRRRVLDVKGWHDEQHLAVRTSGGGVQMGGVWGTAFPHPALKEIDQVGEFPLNDWIPSAFVDLHATSSAYKKKFNLSPGLNHVYLCHGTSIDCDIPSPPSCSANADDHSIVDRDLWWAMIVDAKKDATPAERVRYFCVTRRTHDRGVIPVAAVRWHWQEDDESLWIRCELGCCNVR